MKFLLASTLALSPGLVHSFCMEPNAPRTSAYAVEPSMPYCLSGYKFSGKHSCSRFDLDGYRNDVERYMRQMKEYAEDARAAALKYANEAQEYALCQANKAVAEYNSAFK